LRKATAVAKVSVTALPSIFLVSRWNGAVSRIAVFPATTAGVSATTSGGRDATRAHIAELADLALHPGAVQCG
jgi:hypothetical protein